MPAFIGPIAHLLAEGQKRREDTSRPGHGREFSETLQSSRRQQHNSADDDSGPGEASNGANALAGPTAASGPPETSMENTRGHSRAEMPDSAQTPAHHHIYIPDEPDRQTEGGRAGEEAAAAVEGEGDPVSADVPLKDGSPPAGTAETVAIPVLETGASRAGVEPATPTPASGQGGTRGVPESATNKESDTSEAGATPETPYAGIASPAQAVSDDASNGKTQISHAQTEIPEAGSKSGTADTPGIAATDKTSADASLSVESAEGTLSAAAREGGDSERQTGEGGDGEARQQSDGKLTVSALAETGIKPVTVFSSEGIGDGQPSLQAASASSVGPPLSAGFAPSPGAPVAGAPAAGPGIGAMMAPATMIAAPDELVDIVSNKLGRGDKPDRITVQLDPPELGRVSIEFKFDAQGLQQVAVRAETADAMRQLRLMHFDLVQSLEQHGLSARDMSFSEGFAGGAGQQPDGFIDYTGNAGDEEVAAAFVQAAMPQTRAPLTIGASGLNIKL